MVNASIHNERSNMKYYHKKTKDKQKLDEHRCSLLRYTAAVESDLQPPLPSKEGAGFSKTKSPS